MNIDGAISESKLSYPVWIVNYLTCTYPAVFEDLLLRRPPKWLKPRHPEDYYSGSIVQKILLWANPNFIQSSLQFIMHVHQIYREDVPVLDLGHVFTQSVSSFEYSQKSKNVFVSVGA